MPAYAMDNPALRSRRMERAFAAYDGDAPKPLRTGADGSNDSVRVNLARQIVDSYTSLTINREVGLSTDGSAAIADAEAFLDLAWPADARVETLAKLRTMGGISGMAFARIVPSADGTVRVIVLDPMTVDIISDPMDVEHILAYVITVESRDARGKLVFGRQTHRRVINETGATVGWEIVDETSADGRKWTQVGVTAWPSPLCQIVSAANLPSSGGVWGTADLEADLLDLCEAADRALSNAAKIARLTASPIEYTRGLTDPKSQAAYERRAPGSAVHLFDEAQGIGIIESNGAGIDSTVALYEKIVAQIERVSALPDLTQTDAAIAASGRALEVRLTPMIARVESLRRSYGKLAREIAARVFAFTGIEPPAQIRVVWAAILPVDPAAQVARAQALAALGASRETVLETAGLNPDVEGNRAGGATAEPAADLTALLDRLGGVA
jgi:hypothetical protein